MIRSYASVVVLRSVRVCRKVDEERCLVGGSEERRDLGWCLGGLEGHGVPLGDERSLFPKPGTSREQRMCLVSVFEVSRTKMPPRAATKVSGNRSSWGRSNDGYLILRDRSTKALEFESERMAVVDSERVAHDLER